MHSLNGKWKGMVLPENDDAIHDPETGISADRLREVGLASVEVPSGFVCKLHQAHDAMVHETNNLITGNTPAPKTPYLCATEERRIWGRS